MASTYFPLPDDIVLSILLLLDGKNVRSFGNTCRRFSGLPYYLTTCAATSRYTKRGQARSGQLNARRRAQQHLALQTVVKSIQRGSLHLDDARFNVSLCKALRDECLRTERSALQRIALQQNLRDHSTYTFCKGHRVYPFQLHV
ncbi:hypothetical protein KIN20_010534 [Parelaphostrongylus tenuis]|uniref:F-box domain-containing protein n=1 Tax=Parelaphostrongylus tenuis TaxID=148309 RepID=A0AAD5M802_PARTN|nr:hypothetical protein KIN20_010534 [Parelaphostrongylus tenuis]